MAGPTGPIGYDGEFDYNAEFDELETNNKTIISAINEVFQYADSSLNSIINAIGGDRWQYRNISSVTNKFDDLNKELRKKIQLPYEAIGHRNLNKIDSEMGENLIPLNTATNLTDPEDYTFYRQTYINTDGLFDLSIMYSFDQVADSRKRNMTAITGTSYGYYAEVGTIDINPNNDYYLVVDWDNEKKVKLNHVTITTSDGVEVSGLELPNKFRFINDVQCSPTSGTSSNWTNNTTYRSGTASIIYNYSSMEYGIEIYTYNKIEVDEWTKFNLQISDGITHFMLPRGRYKLWLELDNDNYDEDTYAQLRDNFYLSYKIIEQKLEDYDETGETRAAVRVYSSGEARLNSPATIIQDFNSYNSYMIISLWINSISTYDDYNIKISLYDESSVSKMIENIPIDEYSNMMTGYASSMGYEQYITPFINTWNKGRFLKDSIQIKEALILDRNNPLILPMENLTFYPTEVVFTASNIYIQNVDRYLENITFCATSRGSWISSGYYLDNYNNINLSMTFEGTNIYIYANDNNKYIFYPNDAITYNGTKRTDGYFDIIGRDYYFTASAMQNIGVVESLNGYTPPIDPSDPNVDWSLARKYNLLGFNYNTYMNLEVVYIFYRRLDSWITYYVSPGYLSIDEDNEGGAIVTTYIDEWYAGGWCKVAFINKNENTIIYAPDSFYCYDVPGE